MLRKTITVAMALLMTHLSVFASTPLTRGTSLAVRITSPISSKQQGSPSAIVEYDVKSEDGKVLIKRGTLVELQVDRKKAKGCGKAGYVAVNCLSTTTVDGQVVSLNGSTSDEGDDKTGLAVGLGVGLGLTFLPIVGFAFLAIKGEQASIQPNTIISNVFITNDYTVE